VGRLTGFCVFFVTIVRLSREVKKKVLLAELGIDLGVAMMQHLLCSLKLTNVWA